MKREFSMDAFQKGIVGYFVFLGGLLLVMFALAGCAQMFTAKTSARYVIHPDGTREVFYESNKEQVGLDASVDKNGLIHVKVDKAGTQESVIAATLALQLQVLKLIEALSAKAAPLAAGS